MAETRARGRLFDPAVGRAALAATLALLTERGYAGLRAADVAERASIGPGTLYRTRLTAAEWRRAGVVECGR